MDRKKVFSGMINALIAILSFFILLTAIGFQREAPKIEKIKHIESAMIRIGNGDWKEEKLPLVLNNLKSTTQVSLKANISPYLEQCVLVQTDHSNARIFLDHILVFEMGKRKNYPWTMKYPGREAHAIETYGNGEEKELRIDYNSPQDGGRLIIYQPMLGSAKELLMERGKEFGMGILLSMAQILTGIALIIVSTYIAIIDQKGQLFYWLGLFSVLTGFWFFSGNNASVALFPQSAFLYLSSYIGLFLAPVVLFRFVRESIEFEEEKHIQRLEIIFSITAIIMFILQIAGIIPFHRSIIIFFMILTIAVINLFYLVLKEAWKNQNVDAKQFVLPIVIVVFSDIFALLQLSNPLNRLFAFLHQFGIVLFLLLIGIIVATHVRDSMNLQKQLTKLAYEEKMIRIQSEEQRNVAVQLVKNEETLSYQRHNLRHHLAVIQELAGDNENLQEYLTTLSEKIPKKRESFCENNFVNAIVSHYFSQCEEYNIKFDAKLIVPETGSYSTDSDLCNIFANILENAVEACQRMEEGERFITIKSNTQNKLLTIVMDNSFNGEVTKLGDKFRSAKRNNLGVGLASVQSIAKEYHGDANFVAEDKLFSSSIYLSLL